MSEAPARWGGLKRFLFGKSLKRTLLRALLLVSVVTIAYHWFLLPFIISGDSMLPTLLDGEVHVAYRLAYRSRPPERGDIVVIDIAGGRQFLVKRIVALPGERFAFKDGVILINGQPLNEPYLKARSRDWNRPEIILRPDEFYFVGDNRSMDMASHTTDTVRLERIAGKLLF